MKAQDSQVLTNAPSDPSIIARKKKLVLMKVPLRFRAHQITDSGTGQHRPNRYSAKRIQILFNYLRCTLRTSHLDTTAHAVLHSYRSPITTILEWSSNIFSILEMMISQTRLLLSGHISILSDERILWVWDLGEERGRVIHRAFEDFACIFSTLTFFGMVLEHLAL